MSDRTFSLPPVDPLARAVHNHAASTGHTVSVEEEHWEGEVHAWCRECDWRVSDKIRKTAQDAP
jgi:hypothetical protein